jgi:transposase
MGKKKHPKADLYAKERESGKSVIEIAEMYGVSYQAVSQATAKLRNGYFKHYTEKSCVYPNLRKWLNDNKVSRSEFARRMELPPTPTNTHRISYYFTGRSYPSKATIDKFLKATGLTYEELFWEGERKNEWLD